MQDVLTLALIVKKCKELLNGRMTVFPEGKPYGISFKDDGYGQQIYVIQDYEYKPEPGRRGRGARVVIPPDGKVWAEWNVFKDEKDILEFIS